MLIKSVFFNGDVLYEVTHLTKSTFGYGMVKLVWEKKS